MNSVQISFRDLFVLHRLTLQISNTTAKIYDLQNSESFRHQLSNHIFFQAWGDHQEVRACLRRCAAAGACDRRIPARRVWDLRSGRRAEWVLVARHTPACDPPSPLACDHHHLACGVPQGGPASGDRLESFSVQIGVESLRAVVEVGNWWT